MINKYKRFGQASSLCEVFFKHTKLMQDFRRNLVETSINRGKDLLTSMTNNMIKDEGLRGLTN